MSVRTEEPSGLFHYPGRGEATYTLLISRYKLIKKNKRRAVRRLYKARGGDLRVKRGEPEVESCGYLSTFSCVGKFHSAAGSVSQAGPRQEASLRHASVFGAGRVVWSF